MEDVSSSALLGNHTMSSGEVELRIRTCQIRRGWNPVWPRVMLSRKLRLKALLMKKIAPSLNTLVRASWRVALVCAGLLLLTTGSSTAQTASVIRWVAVYEENNSPDKMLRLPSTSSERRRVPFIYLTEWKCELHWNQSVQRTHIEERLSVRCLLDDGRATAADEAICSYWFDPGEVRMEQRGTLTLTERKRHQATMDLSCRLEPATSP